jgi:catechol 2,3-dioxygenase-like lactoylglutathione lyase family enzyme
MRLRYTTLVVDDYDAAITFFVDVLGFELVEDSPATTSTTGAAKRWVVVRPPGADTGLLLARADGDRQRAAVGDQYAGRVGHFLEVDDAAAEYERLVALGVEFEGPPRVEAYGARRRRRRLRRRRLGTRNAAAVPTRTPTPSATRAVTNAPADTVVAGGSGGTAGAAATSRGAVHRLSSCGLAGFSGWNS